MGVNLRLNSIGCEGEYPHKKPRTIDSSMVFSSIVSHRTTHLEEGGPAITVSIPNNWRILLHTFFFKPKTLSAFFSQIMLQLSLSFTLLTMVVFFPTEPSNHRSESTGKKQMTYYFFRNLSTDRVSQTSGNSLTKDLLP